MYRKKTGRKATAAAKNGTRRKAAATAKRGAGRKATASVRSQRRRITAVEIQRRGGKWASNAGKRSKSVWVDIGPGFVLLHDGRGQWGQVRWALTRAARSPTRAPMRAPSDVKPVIRFFPVERVLTINTYKVRFKRTQDFAFAQKCLARHSRK
jgi:hypothetical protein